MNLEDITLVLGLDAAHLEELRWTWPTWMRFKPELRAMPALVFYDPAEIDPRRVTFLEEHRRLRWVPWEMPAAESQREKMITGFVHIPAREVQTPWYLKLDTDAVATGPGEWIKEHWFAPGPRGRTAVMVSSKWSYSKPHDVIELLDRWAEGVRRLRRYPPLNLIGSPEKNRVRHRRIISWIFFCQTQWTREVAGWLGPNGRLPHPSQDTFLFYCNKRMRRRIVRERMSKYGWKHTQLWKIRGLVGGLGMAAAELSAPSLASSPRASRAGEESRARPAELSASSLASAPESRGVIYYNHGTGAAVRLLVSLASLRQHYTGPVMILSDGEDSHVLCRKIAAEFDAEMQEWTPDIPPGRHTTYLAKTLYHTASPYEVTVCLDNDTLIVGRIDELFDFAATSGFAVAQLARWRSDGSTIGRRVRGWSEWLPDWIEPALRFGPAINCGVIAFHKDASLLREWCRCALPGRETFIPDEVCCQILLHRHPHTILHGRWNRSCKHDDPALADTRIIHYHGRKHCRSGLPYHAARWVAAFDEAVEQNLAGVRDWMPGGDRMLRRFLRSRNQHGLNRSLVSSA